MKRILPLLLALILCAAALADIPDTSRVADASEMTDVQDIVPDGMTPVTADMLNDGVYEDIAVDASSSMFKIVGCTLIVADGQMTATLAMKSEAYSYMYPDTAEAAAKAPFEALIPLTDMTFTLPVDALNAAYTCAAFSARKEAWYPRTLLFHADSLPLSAWKTLTTAETLALADGYYTCEVTLTGSGKAALHSPAALTVANGICTAEITFSTSKIDYVLVNGEQYAPTSTRDGAAFTVPVAAFDVGLSIVADSTAISPATEVPYAMTFDSSTLTPQDAA